MNNTRLPFQSLNPVEAESKLKIDNSKSRFGKKNEINKQTQAQFNQQVDEIQEHQNEVVKDVAKLSKQYTYFIKDTKLSETKGPIQLELEASIPKELADLILLLNNDESQPEGIGSVGGILLLLKCNLIQRDIINELRYRVHTLENKLSSNPKTDDQ